MAGNANIIRIAALDWATDSWVSPPNDINFTPVSPTVTASSTAAGYDADNVLNWKRHERWKSATTTAAQSIEYDFSGTLIASEYNLVTIWLHNNSITSDVQFIYGDDITLETSATGAWAGEEVTEFTISTADLGAGAFSAYTTVSNSRMLVFPTLSVRNTATSPYIRITWAANASARSVSMSKLSVFASEQVENVVGDVRYNLNNRNIYNAKEDGGFVPYQKDYTRTVNYNTKYNDGTFNFFANSGYLKKDLYTEPFVLVLDYDNVWEDGGRHLHTVPCLWQEGMNIKVKPQYTVENMYGEIPYKWREFF